MNEQEQALEQLRRELGLRVEDKPLLEQALTHPAYFEGLRHAAGDNQRLEFLGDAVLDLVVGEYLYHRYPEAPEGRLSKMRAFIVCEAGLARAACEIGIQPGLRLGRGSEAGGDRGRPSVLADAFEAVMGAVFVCRGMEGARQVILSRLGSYMDKLTPEDYEDKKSLLQEIVQARAPHGVTYRLLGSSGPDHCPSFTSGAYCGQVLLGQGQGRSKKESETAAAAAALKRREEWLPGLR